MEFCVIFTVIDERDFGTYNCEVQIVSANLYLDLLEVAHHADAGSTPLRVHIYHWQKHRKLTDIILKAQQFEEVVIIFIVKLFTKLNEVT